MGFLLASFEVLLEFLDGVLLSEYLCLEVVFHEFYFFMGDFVGLLEDDVLPQL